MPYWQETEHHPNDSSSLFILDGRATGPTATDAAERYRTVELNGPSVIDAGRGPLYSTR